MYSRKLSVPVLYISGLLALVSSYVLLTVNMPVAPLLENRNYDIMSPKEKQATPKVAFVFLGPLTKVPPAYAGSGARQRGEPEYKHNERREKQAAA